MCIYGAAEKQLSLTDTVFPSNYLKLYMIRVYKSLKFGGWVAAMLCNLQTLVIEFVSGCLSQIGPKSLVAFHKEMY